MSGKKELADRVIAAIKVAGPAEKEELYKIFHEELEDLDDELDDDTLRDLEARLAALGA